MSDEHPKNVPSNPYKPGGKNTLGKPSAPPKFDPQRTLRKFNRKERVHKDGWMVESHLGGVLENVPGFPSHVAMTHGFNTQILPIRNRPTNRKKKEDANDSTEKDWLKPERRFGEETPWTQILDTSVVPWRCICQLEIQYTDGRTAFGSAWFSGPNTLITAGHNVYDPATGSGVSYIRIVPARNATLAPFGETYAIDVDVLPGWMSGQPEYDLGMIRIPDGLGSITGWFGYAVLTDNDLAAAPLIQSAGYPAETRPFATQWYDAGRAQYYSQNFMSYRVDTEEGQSGAPIFFSNQNGQRWVVATHVYDAQLSNFGLRFNNEIFQAIQFWST